MATDPADLIAQAQKCLELPGHTATNAGWWYAEARAQARAVVTLGARLEAHVRVAEAARVHLATGSHAPALIAALAALDREEQQP